MCVLVTVIVLFCAVVPTNVAHQKEGIILAPQAYACATHQRLPVLHRARIDVAVDHCGYKEIPRCGFPAVANVCLAHTV